MNQTKLNAYIGFAARARKCQYGDFCCEKLVKCGKARLVLIDSETSPSTAEKYNRLCQNAGIECLGIAELGRLVGREANKIAAITDAHFAQMIAAAYIDGGNQTKRGGMDG